MARIGAEVVQHERVAIQHEAIAIAWVHVGHDGPGGGGASVFFFQGETWNIAHRAQTGTYQEMGGLGMNMFEQAKIPWFKAGAQKRGLKADGILCIGATASKKIGGRRVRAKLFRFRK